MFLRCVFAAVVISQSVLADDTFPKIRNTQAAGEHPPSPQEMLDLFELPPGFKVTLFAGEPDVQQPIAFDFDDFGRIWVAENYSYSARGKVDQVMRDRVIILHDKDGDGEHDERKVFWDKGHMLTGLTWGYGGLWVLNNGTLSFIPDEDGDDVPDSEPIPMLNGWTKNAGHNVVNGLLWGPDGWLYGRHGITDTSLPGTLDTPKEERSPMNCGIWRFHPVKHTFEIVCHGTTNPWGLDYNEVGDMFMSNNVIGHLWHVIPGAHYQRMFGQDFNPHCYELMGPISDHYHWDDTGKWSESRDGKANDLGGGHSHCGLMLYYGENFPREYWGKAFMCNTHGRCVNVDRIERKGSSYVAKHEPNFLKVNTPWFRGVDLKYGPAGCVYLSDWSDNGECHDHDGVHRTSGRIYRISYGEVRAAELVSAIDAERIDQPNLRSRLTANEWVARHAARQYRESDGLWTSASAKLLEDLITKEYPMRVRTRATSLLKASQLLTASMIDQLLKAEEAGIRRSVISGLLDYQLPGGLRKTALPTALSRLADKERDQRVRAAILSELTKRPSGWLGRWLILQSLIPDTDDANYQLLFYHAAECAVSDLRVIDSELATEAMFVFAARGSGAHRKLMARRVAEEFGMDSPQVHQLLRFSLGAPEEDVAPVLDGVLDATSATSKLTEPKWWADLALPLKERNNRATQTAVRSLETRFGSVAAKTELWDLLLNRSAVPHTRLMALESLKNQVLPAEVPNLLKLLNDRAVYAEVARAMSEVDDDPRIPKELLRRWNGLRHGAKEAATDTLCSRKSYAVEFTKAIETGRIDASVLTAAQVRQLNAFNDSSITAIVDKHWGVINETPEALEAAIGKWKQELTDEVLAKADLENGAALFKKSCASCHKLYGEGGKIGPDLTGGNRANMDYLLGNVINPSGEVPKQYTTSILQLESGRVITGVVVSETDQVIQVQTDKELRTIAKSDIEERKRTGLSLMPNGLLDNLTSDDVRDLIAFVRQRR